MYPATCVASRDRMLQMDHVSRCLKSRGVSNLALEQCIFGLPTTTSSMTAVAVKSGPTYVLYSIAYTSHCIAYWLAASNECPQHQCLGREVYHLVTDRSLTILTLILGYFLTRTDGVFPKVKTKCHHYLPALLYCYRLLLINIILNRPIITGSVLEIHIVCMYVRVRSQ